MYLKITTLSCKVGSMKLRLQWPWRARRCKITPDESVQYWCLFLFPPPPVILFFHLSSDQQWQCKKCFWRLSLILQSSIAPSSSLGGLPWRRRYITFFDTSLSEKEYFRRSTSVQVLFPIGTVLGEEPAGSRLCGFALAFDRFAKSFASNFNAYSSNCFWNFWFIVVQIHHHHNPIWSMRNSDPRISTPYLPCRQQDVTSNTGPILVFPRIQLFGSDVSSSLGKVHSRQEPLHPWRVGTLQYLSSMKCCPIQQHSEILHPHKICSICLVVTTFQFVFRICATEDPLRVQGTSVLITPGTNEELDCPPTTDFPVLSWKDSFHTFVRLLRKYWAD